MCCVIDSSSLPILVRMFSFNGIITTVESPMWNMHIDVPADITLALKTQKISRLICTFNGKQPSHCALMSHGDGNYFILLNKERSKKLGVSIGSPVLLHIEADQSTYGMPMPEEMAELMRQDPEADRHFHALTPGKQRSLLFIIGKPKGSETRLKKAIGICEYLKSVNGALDFQEMNQALKENRFKLR